MNKGEQMEKIKIKKDLFCLPRTQTILGTHFAGECVGKAWNAGKTVGERLKQR